MNANGKSVQNRFSTIRTLIDQNAWRYPEKIALKEGDRSYTFKELRDRANQMGNTLKDLGLKKGDRVAFYGENSLEYFELYLSVPNAGLVLVPINFRLAPREIRIVLSDSEPTIVVVPEKYVAIIDEMKNDLPFVTEYIYVGQEDQMPAGWKNYEGLMKDASISQPQVDIFENDLAVLMYTSGTTGLPKGVMQTHLNYYHDGRSVSATMGIDHDDVGLIMCPLFHVTATSNLFADLYRGCTSVILPTFDPELLLQIVEKEKITTGMLATPMVMFLLNHPTLKNYDTSSFKKLYFAGAPVTPVVYKKFIETFGNVLGHYFGTTETTGGTVTLTLKDVEMALEKGNDKIFGSCGKACFDMETYIVDFDDKIISPGEKGEMKTRGLGVATGYWRNEEATKEAFRGEWYYPFDVCTIDEEGYIYVIDRKKDMIISGGENIYPAEIENVLYEHSGIVETAVIGLPDAKWGEVVTAIIVLKEGQQATEKEIIEFCRGKIGGYKIPKAVYFDTVLPRNPSGKILKYVIREKYEKGER